MWRFPILHICTITTPSTIFRKGEILVTLTEYATAGNCMYKNLTSALFLSLLLARRRSEGRLATLSLLCVDLLLLCCLLSLALFLLSLCKRMSVWRSLVSGASEPYLFPSGLG